MAALAATTHLTLTFSIEGDEIGTATMNVPINLTAGPIEDGHVHIDTDTAAYRDRITAALEAFAAVAEADNA